MSSYICLVKRAHVTLVNTYDEVIPGDRLTLIYGLQALLRADALDTEREDQLWAKADLRCARANEDEVGAGAQGRITVEDDYFMSHGGYGYGYGYGFGSIEYAGDWGGW